MVRLVRSTQVLLAVLCFVSVVLYLMFYLPTRLISTTPTLHRNFLASSERLLAAVNVTEDFNSALQHNNNNNNDTSLPITKQQTVGLQAGVAATSSSNVSTNSSAVSKPKLSEVVSSTLAAKLPSNVMAIPAAGNSNHGAGGSSSTADSTIHGVLANSIYEAGHTDSNPDLCPNLGTNLRLLAIIMSAPNHFTARQAIRQTWGHYTMRRDVAIGFLIGSTKNDKKLEADLTVEQQIYGDLIRGRFVDTYNNLTLKTISMLEWVDNFCPKTSFVLKTDDDMFINVNKLLAFINKHYTTPCKKVIYGRLAKKWKPIRNAKSKYYVSMQQYNAPVFPDFTTGPAYLLATCAVHDLYVASLNHTYLKLEDVFTTGIVAHQIGVKRVHANEFLNKRIAFNPCNVQKAISIHMVKYSEQFDLWKKLLDGKTKCKK